MKALVLSSGGVDSTTCLGMAVEKYGAENVLSLSIAYGQKHDKEILASDKVAIPYWLICHNSIHVILTLFFLSVNKVLLYDLDSRKY